MLKLCVHLGFNQIQRSDKIYADVVWVICVLFCNSDHVILIFTCIHAYTFAYCLFFLDTDTHRIPYFKHDKSKQPSPILSLITGT